MPLLSLVGGWLEVPETIDHLWPGLRTVLGHRTVFTDLVQTALPAPRVVATASNTELTVQVITSVVVLGGILLAAVLFLRRPRVVPEAVQPPWWQGVYLLWFVGWGFDWLYHSLIVQPFMTLARANKEDVVDAVPDRIARLSQRAHHLLSQTQTGQVRWYAASMAAGAILVIALVVFT
jgi:NADH-quinone oxidoreductase subunit L